ncbi:hypothetical protein [Chryseobacterium indoltheticum]|uniref:hypothetical protein n=1 Tax=Chryseobacterium indoltheticum TaxID=254 RepID=UPI003F497C9F
MLTKALMQKAMQGEADPKQLEFYVTVEYYSHKKHATDNVNINNPFPQPQKPKAKPATIPKAKDSPAAAKPASKKEEAGIMETVTSAGKELWDWFESRGTATKDKQQTVQEPDGKSLNEVNPLRGQEKKDGKCECYCGEKEISSEELKEMVIAMRKATFDDAGENFYKWNKDNLFTAGHEKFVDKSYSKFAEVLNKTFTKYDITSCIRKIHFLAQCYHETGAFMRSVEGNSKR